MAHVYVTKKFNPALRYFRVELSSGKSVLVTISYKERLETVKELEALIAKETEILEINETSLTKKEVSAVLYEQTRLKAMRERTRLEERKAVRENLVYKGESIKFLGYVNSELAAAG